MPVAIFKDIYHQTVEPGMDVFVLPRKYNKKYAVVGVKYGSVDNEFIVPGEDEGVVVPAGIAHFLEHKMFDEEWGNVFERFSQLGASANAYTSYTVTAYLFSATEGFWESFELLLDFVQQPYFTPESVAKEKGIIQQELMMIEDDPDRKLFSSLLQGLFQRHPVRIEIGGTVDSIAKITPELLYDCHRTFYHPANMAVCVVGDVDPDEVTRRVREDLQGRDYEPQGEIRRIMPTEPAEVHRARMETKMLVSRPRLGIGFKEAGPPLKGKDLLRREAATNLLLQAVLGRSSPLYSELYEAGLIDDQFGLRYYASEHFGFTMIEGETEDPDILYQRIIEGLAKARDEGVALADLERLRKKSIGRLINAFDSSDYVANSLLSYHFEGTSLRDYLDVLQDLTLADLEERWRHLDPKAAASTIIRPMD
jgi:predicted Zn-dependent peptidase